MERGLALDIDNVLSATNLYWAQEMHKLYGNPEGLTPEEVVQKYVLTSDVPYWQTPEAIEWMAEARVSNELQAELPLIENAHHVVNKISEIVPIKAYITARWERIREKTEAWLWKHEFPNAPVFMRPEDTEHLRAMEWKAQFLPTMYPEIVGIVDDDPRLIQYLSDDYPGTIFLYKNTEHRETPIDVIKCADWNAVLKEVTRQYGFSGR